MNRYEKIKNMSVEELSKFVVKCADIYIDEYCKNDCDSLCDCPHPEKCCKRWLLEEIESK